MVDEEDDEKDDGGYTNVCVDCGMTSPRTNTNYTLISSRYGWRLTRRVDEKGKTVSEWRCPSCWEIFRKRLPTTGTAAAPAGTPAAGAVATKGKVGARPR